MDDALDLMQQYNGRTKTFCICEAMGWKHTNSEHNRFLKTSIKSVKKYTNQPSPW